MTPGRRRLRDVSRPDILSVATSKVSYGWKTFPDHLVLVFHCMDMASPIEEKFQSESPLKE